MNLLKHIKELKVLMILQQKVYYNFIVKILEHRGITKLNTEKSDKSNLPYISPYFDEGSASARKRNSVLSYRYSKYNEDPKKY